MASKKPMDDDVEGHGGKMKSAPEGVTPKRSAVEDDDVEGHGGKMKSAPEGVTPKRSAVEDDDVEGHGGKMKSAPEGVTPKRSAVEDDDVEGHDIGTMRLSVARELNDAKVRDVQRATSRNNLISEAKRALRRKD
jgi:hypothetical protein